MTYVRASPIFSNQPNILQYLNYVAFKFDYPANNLVGVYVYPANSNLILLRYKADNKFISLLATISSIQEILNSIQNQK